MSILAACVALCALLLAVLQVFIRPIMWALLTSSFLFSTKRQLTASTRAALGRVRTTGSTLSLSVLVWPVRFLDSCVDRAYTAMTTIRRANLVLLLSAVLAFNFSGYIEANSLSFVGSLFERACAALTLLANAGGHVSFWLEQSWQSTCTLIAAYLLAVAMFGWRVEYARALQLLAVPVWLVVLVSSGLVASSYRPVLALGLFVLILLGLFSMVHETVTRKLRRLAHRSSSRPLLLNYDDDDHHHHNDADTSEHEACNETTTTAAAAAAATADMPIGSPRSASMHSTNIGDIGDNETMAAGGDVSSGATNVAMEDDDSTSNLVSTHRNHTFVLQKRFYLLMP